MYDSKYQMVNEIVDEAVKRGTPLPSVVVQWREAWPKLEKSLVRLGLTPRPAGLDLLVYLDAEEADLEDWFAARFVNFWRAAESDPASFYARFRAMSEAETDSFARTVVWGQMNLPNLREHIIRARDEADIVVRKRADHGLDITELS